MTSGSSGQGSAADLPSAGADNKLVIAPGLLSGSLPPCRDVSPWAARALLTGGIKEANSGGQAAQVLARLGYAAVILEGKPADDTLYKSLSTRTA
jgi:aldehyde:ferredoxin oxidoreductase